MTDEDRDKAKNPIAPRQRTLFRKSWHFVKRFNVVLQIKIEFLGWYYVLTSSGSEMKTIQSMVSLDRVRRGMNRGTEFFR